MEMKAFEDLKPAREPVGPLVADLKMAGVPDVPQNWSVCKINKDKGKKKLIKKLEKGVKHNKCKGWRYLELGVSEKGRFISQKKRRRHFWKSTGH